MNYGPKSVTSGMIAAYDAADNNSYVKTNLLQDWVQYLGTVYYQVLGRYWVMLTNNYTNWAGYYPATVTSTGNHVLTFTYYSDADSSSCSVDNDGVMDNSYNSTMSTQRNPQTKVIRVNVTSTGAIQFYFRRNSGGNIYIKDINFFKEPTGLLDLSGNSLTCTAAPSGPSGPIYDADFSGSMVFDGTDDYFATGTSSTLNLGASNYTVTGWFYFDSSTASNNLYHNIFFIQDSTTSGNWIELSKWRSGVYNNGLYYDYNVGNYSSYARVDTATENAVAQWIHFACTRNSSTTQLFLNGVSKGTATITTSWSASSYLVIGRNNYYLYYMKGKIPSLRIYNRALSQTEVLQNFNSTRKRFGV